MKLAIVLEVEKLQIAPELDATALEEAQIVLGLWARYLECFQILSGAVARAEYCQMLKLVLVHSRMG